MDRSSSNHPGRNTERDVRESSGGPEAPLTKVTEALLKASSQITDGYFQLPVAGQEIPVYRERVYCYELYHQWRLCFPSDSAFSLSGEVDKARHLLINDGSKPDFLVHVPGSMNNLLIVEVKPKHADPGRMADDLKKLTRYRRNLKDSTGKAANYEAAYFWVYGLSSENWPKLRDEVRGIVKNPDDVDVSLIKVFVHEKAGAPAVEVSW